MERRKLPLGPCPNSRHLHLLRNMSGLKKNQKLNLISARIILAVLDTRFLEYTQVHCDVTLVQTPFLQCIHAHFYVREWILQSNSWLLLWYWWNCVSYAFFRYVNYQSIQLLSGFFLRRGGRAFAPPLGLCTPPPLGDIWKKIFLLQVDSNYTKITSLHFIMSWFPAPNVQINSVLCMASHYISLPKFHIQIAISKQFKLQKFPGGRPPFPNGCVFQAQATQTHFAPPPHKMLIHFNVNETLYE